MRRLRVGIILALIVLPAGALAGCGKSSSGSNGNNSAETKGGSSSSLPFKTVDPGELTFAYLEYLPRILRNSQGELEGYEAWLLTEVAKKYNLKLKPMPTTFASEILSVEQNKADIGTGAYFSPERAEQVYYTKPNVNDILGFLMKKSEPYSSPASLKGDTIGSETGYVYNKYLEKYYGKSHIKLFNSTTSVVAAVQNGLISAYLGSTGSGVAVVKEHPELILHTLKQGDLSMPESERVAATYEYVNCQNKGLAEAISEVLEEKVESGEWAEQLAPWGLDGKQFQPALEYPEEGC